MVKAKEVLVTTVSVLAVLWIIRASRVRALNDLVDSALRG